MLIDEQDPRVIALHQFVTRARPMVQQLVRTLRRASLFREALQLERFFIELRRHAATLADVTERIEIGAPEGEEQS